MGKILANLGPMSGFVPPFEVRSKLTDQTYHCRFSHLWNGIATRHSDTVDCKFFVDGRGVVVGLAHTAFVEFRERAGRNPTDREASCLAAEYLAERLEEEEEHTLYHVPHQDVLRLADKLGIRWDPDPSHASRATPELRK
jgi:hypothetical protein